VASGGAEVNRIITTHITVSAPVEDVWRCLTDLAAYPDWNPFIIAGDGALTVGERLRLTTRLPGSSARTSRPWVTVVEPCHYVEWLGRLGLPGVLDARHSLTLTATAGERTLVQQSETLTGVLTPVSGAMLARRRAGFVAMNQAIEWRTTRPATSRRRRPTDR
jgi:hypothetical protein